MHARTKFQHSHESHSPRRAILIFASLLLIAVLPFISGCGKNKDGGNVDESFAVTPFSSPSQSCAAGSTYSGNDWAQVPHAQANIVPYGYGVNGYQPNAQLIASQGFCGCPQGTQAMCDASHGVVCMPVQFLTRQNVRWFHQGPQGFQPSGFGAYTGYTNVLDPRTNLPPPTHYGHFRRPQHHQGQWQQHGHLGGRRNGYQGRHQVYNQPAPATLSCSTQIGQTCTVGLSSCGPGARCSPISNNYRSDGYAVGICTQ